MAELSSESWHRAFKAGHVRAFQVCATQVYEGVEGSVAVVPGVTLAVQRGRGEGSVALLEMPVGLPLSVLPVARGAVLQEDGRSSIHGGLIHGGLGNAFGVAGCAIPGPAGHCQDKKRPNEGGSGEPAKASFEITSELMGEITGQHDLTNAQLRGPDSPMNS